MTGFQRPDEPPSYPYYTKTRGDQWKDDCEKAEKRIRELQSLRKRDAIISAIVGFLIGLAICLL